MIDTRRKLPGRHRHLAAASLYLLACALPAGATPPEAALTLLGHAEIPAKGPDGITVEELSGIGWNSDKGLAYAVSDRGTLHHLHLKVENGRLTGATVAASFTLSDKAGAPLAISNAEDLVVVPAASGNGRELLIVMEDGPLAARFSTRGEELGAVALPAAVADPAAYDKKNRGLESISQHPIHGVITAPETPLAGQAAGGMHRLYAADGTSWDFAQSVPGESRLKAIALLEGGDLLALERHKIGKGQQEAHLRHVALSDCGAGHSCKVTEILIDGQPALAGNYEGMAALPDGRILMVTDQSAKKGTPSTLTLLAPAADL